MANSRSSKYESKATTTKISATSRISKKIEETFYTLEFTEERIVPEDADMEQERKILAWHSMLLPDFFQIHM